MTAIYLKSDEIRGVGRIVSGPHSGESGGGGSPAFADWARAVEAGEGEASRSPGEDAFLAGPVEEPGDQGDGRSLVGPVGEVGRAEQDEVAFGAGDVIQEAGAAELSDGTADEEGQVGRPVVG